MVSQQSPKLLFQVRILTPLQNERTIPCLFDIRYTGSMTCPLGDAELLSHTTQGENGLLISFSTCPVCRGYWMESFAANFIKPNSIDRSETGRAASTYSCPICTKPLTRSTGENIPDSVFVYDCPSHHGYFFPTGQLAAFKEAQQVKIAYHRLWNIALPNVSSILLGSFLLLLITGVTILSLQQKPTTESQAQQILTGHAAYSAADRSAVLISATTSVKATVTLHIPAFNNFNKPMQTGDNQTHQLTVGTIPAGTYQYFFTINVSGKETTSDTYTFTTP
jgi:hypothetical protein